MHESWARGAVLCSKGERHRFGLSRWLAEVTKIGMQRRHHGHAQQAGEYMLGIRRMTSDDTFFLSQLDNSFSSSYACLASAMSGFLRGWNQQCKAAVIVDKNRAWLHAIELLLHIEPDAKLLVCLRELGQIYGSIESQHQQTILLDFIDHLADFDRFGRADMLFAKDNTIGAPLISLHAVPDLPKAVKERLFFVRFEDLMAKPNACMPHLFGWLGLRPFEIDLNHLRTGIRESDSHYRMKYPHTQAAHHRPPGRHEIPARIQARIEDAFRWYYEMTLSQPRPAVSQSPMSRHGSDGPTLHPAKEQ